MVGVGVILKWQCAREWAPKFDFWKCFKNQCFSAWKIQKSKGFVAYSLITSVKFAYFLDS